MRIFPFTSEYVGHVVRNMRQADRDEIWALQWDDVDDVAYTVRCMSSGYAFVLGAERPIAYVAGVPMWPNVWQVGMFATDEWPRIAMYTTKFVRRCVIKGLVDTGAIRAFCYSSATHHIAHRWLESLGAERECEQRNFGKNGETFYTYAWHRDSGRYPFIGGNGHVRRRWRR